MHVERQPLSQNCAAPPSWTERLVWTLVAGTLLLLSLTRSDGRHGEQLRAVFFGASGAVGTRTNDTNSSLCGDGLAGNAADGNTAAEADNGAKTVPRIIHQTWLDADIPTTFQDWPASWRRVYPDWEYRLWTDDDNRRAGTVSCISRLVEREYPWFLDTYDAFPENIMRSDAARVLYMHRFGGMYADLDMEALRDLGPILGQETRPVFSAMQTKAERISKSDASTNHIPNAWMASPPGHVFWQFYLAYILRRGVPISSNATAGYHVEKTAGPVALAEAIADYSRQHDTSVTVLPPGTIYPYNWLLPWRCERKRGKRAQRKCKQVVEQCEARRPTFNATLCKAHFPEAYAITYWTHSWG